MSSIVGEERHLGRMTPNIRGWRDVLDRQPRSLNDGLTDHDTGMTGDSVQQPLFVHGDYLGNQK